MPHQADFHSFQRMSVNIFTVVDIRDRNDICNAVRMTSNSSDDLLMQ